MTPARTAAVAALAPSSSLAARAAPAWAEARNVVLVHGAVLDGSGWRAVHDVQVADGHAASVVPTPWPIVAAQDRSVNPDLQRWMHERLGTVVTNLGTSHVPQPEAVAAVMEAAA